MGGVDYMAVILLWKEDIIRGGKKNAEGDWLMSDELPISSHLSRDKLQRSQKEIRFHVQQTAFHTLRSDSLLCAIISIPAYISLEWIALLLCNTHKNAFSFN